MTRCPLLAPVIAAALALAPTLATADSGHAHQVVQTPPVKMGTSGGSVADISFFACCSGTLGSLVRRDGVLEILSNNHVLARSGSAVTGEDDIQPGLVDSGCRSTGDNVVGDFAGNLVPLGHGNVDAALSVARSGMVDATGAIIDIGVPCAAVQAATVGLAVEKSGRTTGLTHGTVQATNMSVQVQYQVGCGQGRKFYITYSNQIAITPGTFSAGGDSGSLIVSDDGTPNPVGLLYAGSSQLTVANPAQDVVNAFAAGGHTFGWVGSACSGFMAAKLPISPAEATLARSVKERHEADLLGEPGVLAVGVGQSDRMAGKGAVIIYADRDRPQVLNVLPGVLEGVDVVVLPTDPFVAR